MGANGNFSEVLYKRMAENMAKATQRDMNKTDYGASNLT
jgi:hypothetical protein